MAADPTIFVAARDGELHVLRKWLDTDGDVNRKYAAPRRQLLCLPAPFLRSHRKAEDVA
jgi:hypothetical protein